MDSSIRILTYTPTRLGCVIQHFSVRLTSYFSSPPWKKLHQALVYHVESHPMVPAYTQCVTFHYFETPTAERAYVIFGVLAMYVVPLTIILVVNAIILWSLQSSQHFHTPKLRRTFTSSLSSDILNSVRQKNTMNHILCIECPVRGALSKKTSSPSLRRFIIYSRFAYPRG